MRLSLWSKRSLRQAASHLSAQCFLYLLFEPLTSHWYP
jgi:hypothetical protein